MSGKISPALLWPSITAAWSCTDHFSSAAESLTLVEHVSLNSEKHKVIRQNLNVHLLASLLIIFNVLAFNTPV